MSVSESDKQTAYLTVFTCVAPVSKQEAIPKPVYRKLSSVKGHVPFFNIASPKLSHWQSVSEAQFQDGFSLFLELE
jgi:hypothetical protein